jgi:hypothetical protein
MRVKPLALAISDMRLNIANERVFVTTTTVLAFLFITVFILLGPSLIILRLLRVASSLLLCDALLF